MFKHIGKKIKCLALVIFALGILASAGVAIGLADVLEPCSFVWQLIAFLLILAVGIVFSWLSVLLLYGFGELVDQTMETNQRLEENHAALEEILAHMKRKDQGSYDQPRRAEPRPAPAPQKRTEIPAESCKKTPAREDTGRDGRCDVDSARLPLRSDPPSHIVEPASNDRPADAANDTNDTDGHTLYIPKA